MHRLKRLNLDRSPGAGLVNAVAFHFKQMRQSTPKGGFPNSAFVTANLSEAISDRLYVENYPFFCQCQLEST